MRKIDCEVAVIGGGPAGLAAAVGAYDAGAKDVIVIERDKHLGGILQQCIHNGFGLHVFGEDLTGPEYAQRYIEQAGQRQIKCLRQTMVLELGEGNQILAAKAGEGIIRIDPKAIVLAMGCRERTRGAISLPGARPAGILTAGTAQRFINMEGYLPGKKIVILGSGDIGMIMARRLHLEGAQVKAVVEIMECIGGLNRNLVQCLGDFDIPLYLQHTVTDIRGQKRLESVKVAPLINGKADTAREFVIDCDTLLLSVGLIPENELSKQVGVKLDSNTGGPMVDQYFQTSVPGMFAAGNIVLVFDLVDHVSVCGHKAGESAAMYAQGKIKGWNGQSVSVGCGEGIRCVVPQKLNNIEGEQEVRFYMRAAQVHRQAKLKMTDDRGETICEKRFQIARPPEMLSVQVAGVKTGTGKKYVFELQGEV